MTKTEEELREEAIRIHLERQGGSEEPQRIISASKRKVGPSVAEASDVLMDEASPDPKSKFVEAVGHHLTTDDYYESEEVVIEAALWLHALYCDCGGVGQSDLDAAEAHQQKGKSNGF